MMFLKKIIDRLGAPANSIIWPNCHSACRALRIHFGDEVTIVDGHLMGRQLWEVFTLGGEETYSVIHPRINHSWLVLPDGARVDPFPAGIYSASPLLFPPFGNFEDVFPGSVYIEAETSFPETRTSRVWETATNIARVLAYFPKFENERDMHSREGGEVIATACDEAYKYVLKLVQKNNRRRVRP